MTGGRRERGAGTVLAVALLGAISVATGTALLAVGALAAQRQVQSAADAAALAAADTLSGRAAGYPCANAERAAALNEASVSSCSSDGLIATVSVTRDWARLWLQAAARAGPVGSD
jgi:secretion/DNA translocation related TadE-like protein